jgi:glycosyltransferase involved in cell wall biosynthesis
VLSDALLDRLKRWDAVSSKQVDRFAAISGYICDRIARCYSRDASVIYPPVDTLFFTPGGLRDDYFLAASRWVPYKRIDLIVESFGRMPDRRLIVVGDGPEAPRVRAVGGSNVEFVGEVSRERLRELLRSARAFIFAAEEDFGILPVEAQACGTPVIAYRRGGVLETVRGLDASRPTGVFFDDQSPEAIAAAVRQFDAQGASIDPAACRANAERFAATHFRAAFLAFVGNAWTDFASAKG